MDMVVRLAVGLARNTLPEHRWRRVAVPVTAAIALLLVLIGTSVVMMVEREAAREAGRTVRLATAPAQTDLLMANLLDSWRGDYYPVVWIEPAGTASPVLPPGMRRVPDPGQAVVSPALARLAARHPDLAARYPNRVVLGQEGLRGAGELIAFVRPAEGRSLANDGRVMRVRAFGPLREGEQGGPLGMSHPVPPVPVALGVLGFLVLPGLLVLALGVASASSVRDHRFAVLRWLGAPPRTLTGLAVLETELLALPGFAVATVLWALIAPRLDRVPLVGHEVLRADLGLPWWLLGAELGGGLAVAGLLGVGMTALRGWREMVRPRPGEGRSRITLLRVVPLVSSAGLLAFGASTVGYRGATFLLAGVVVAIPSVPLLLPGLLRPLGLALCRLDSVPALLAGRRLAWEPVRTARPFAAVAALIVLAAVTAGYVAVQRQQDPPPLPPPGPQAVEVLWRDPRPDDASRLAAALGMGLVIPTEFDEAEHTRVLGTTCYELARILPDTACRADVPFALPSETEHRLAEVLRAPAGGIRLAARDDIAVKGLAIVIDAAPGDVLAERVRSAAMPLLPGLVVNEPWALLKHESPLVPWLLGGIITALVTLTIGCVVAIVDRYLATRHYRRHLLRLGLTPPRLMVLEVWQFAVPYGLTVSVSFGAGLALCGLITSLSDPPMPWQTLGAILGLAIVAGLVGTVCVAVFGARSVQESPHQSS